MSNLKCGIVGLPNVGKSTLFNALIKSKAAVAANYPFCTLEPNIGMVEVYDVRLQQLAQMAKSRKIVPSYMEFVDIAGLIKGASTGQGLGNKFLDNIRDVDAIVHVVRCFDDADITHVHGKVDPEHDITVIEDELRFADIAKAEKLIEKIEKKARVSRDQDLKNKMLLLENSLKILDKGMLHQHGYSEKEKPDLKSMGFITSKPLIYVANVSEEDIPDGNTWSNIVLNLAKKAQVGFIMISATAEEQMLELSPEETRDLNQASGLSKLALLCRDILHLQTYYTVGEKEARSWQFKRGTMAPEAAGIIHSDMEKGFIRAEVIAYDDYIQCKGEAGARSQGKMALQGKKYEVCDGDIMHFRFNV